ncbi:hypothetical protein MTO96_020902 [Rhipicephalus appendiculatus]
MMQDLLKVLPDDLPITDVCIIEDPQNCPPGYHVVDKTFDQDTDADLWKDRFFGRRITRYICYSKAHHAECVQSLLVVADKEVPPEGHIVMNSTKDTDGFVLAGEVNSLLIGYKLTTVAPINGRKNSYHQPPLPPLPYPLPSHVDDHLQKKSPGGRVCQRGKSLQKSAIDDVPFEVNPKYRAMFRLSEFSMPNIRIKTANEIFEEYNYNFQVERQAQQT